MKRRFVPIFVISPLVLTLVATASPAQAASQTPASGTFATTDSILESVTYADLYEVSEIARSNGDFDGASILTAFAEQRLGSTGAQTYNVWTNVAKKAAIKFLRWGSDKVPQSIRPWAHKIADVLETLTDMQEIPIATALMSAGIPPDVAWETARWIVIFIGL